MYKTLINKRRKIFTIIISMILVSVLLISGCGKKEEKNVIKVGAVLPLSGKLAHYGENERNALNMAENFINNKNLIKDYKIEFIFEDSKADPKEAVAITKKLINIEKVKILFIFKSTLIHATMPIIDKSNVLALAFCMDPKIVSQSSNIFRIYPNMEQQNKVMINHLKTLDSKRIAIFHISTPATEELISNYLRPNIRKMRKKIVALESFTKKDITLKSQSLKIKSANPDIIITLAHSVFIPQIIKSLNEIGIRDDVKILGDLGYVSNLDIADSLLEDIHFISPIYALNRENNNVNRIKFIKKYKEKYDKSPGYDPAFFYDAAVILAKGIEEKGYDVDKLKDFLINIKNYQGITGDISMLPSGNAQISMEIGYYHNGEKLIYSK